MKLTNVDQEVDEAVNNAENGKDPTGGRFENGKMTNNLEKRQAA